MRRVLQRNDIAVSPIIGTVLLVAITVTLVATMYTVLGGYFNGLPGPSPTASLTVVNETQSNGGLVNGSYSLSVTYISNNVSTQHVKLEVTLSNGTVYLFQLSSAEGTGPSNYTLFSGQGGALTANYTGTPGFLTSYSTITFNEHNATSYLVRIDMIDTTSDSSMGSVDIIS